MSDYRRLYTPGGTFFFTVVTAGRRPLFADPHNVQLLRRAFQYVRERRPFEIVAAVILPDHLHCLWRLPDGDADFSTRWQMIKTDVSRHMSATTKDGAKAIWQPRFWEHLIRDEEDLRRHLDYIHFNPVKHGLVADPGAWEPSSFRRFAKAGWYAPGWGACEPENLSGVEIE
jgi:putative transposase